MLARLKLSDVEVTRLAAELSAIVSYFDQLNELDTTDVPPMAHALSVLNVYRAAQRTAGGVHYRRGRTGSGERPRHGSRRMTGTATMTG